MIEREVGVILMALIDGLHAQHPILQQGAPRPAGQQFAQWLPGQQGRQLGVSGVIDLHRLTQDVKHSMDAALDGAKVQAAAEWAALDRLVAAEAQQAAELELADPFPALGAPEPVQPDAGPRCAHCGLFIQRVTSGAGKGWRHTASQFLGCGPDHETLAEL